MNSVNGIPVVLDVIADILRSLGFAIGLPFDYQMAGECELSVDAAIKDIEVVIGGLSGIYCTRLRRAGTRNLSA